MPFADEMAMAVDPRRAQRPQVGSGQYALDFLNPLSRPPPGGYALPPAAPPPAPRPAMRGEVMGPPMPEQQGPPQSIPVGSWEYLLDLINPLSRPPPGGYSR